MDDGVIETVIDGKKISLKVSENLDVVKKAIEIVRKELAEIKSGSSSPISREDAFLLTALNIAGCLIKERSREFSQIEELSPELLEKIEKAIS